ncbi:MAG: UvrB/UvrC motif-containing protein [Clostridia bacterium]|nr:UvrB/UvrC motif-containing protein [Clostridia bacterium]
MLCERCGKNPATTYYKEVVNGKTKEIHLCSECAEELGNGLFQGMNGFADFGLSSLLGSLFAQSMPVPATSVKRCSSCGTSFEELAQNAQAGCANCYKEFYTQLLPSIERIHGKTRHIGKVPASASKELRQHRELEELRQRLADAVNAQEYEKAAELRDKIRGLEGENGK